MQHLRDIFRRLTGKPAIRQEASVEELRTLLKSRFLHFKILIKANNELLEIMSDMEAMLKSGRSFGMSYVRSHCTAISVNLFKIVENLNLISNNKYRELDVVSDQVRRKISDYLAEKRAAGSSEYVIPFAMIDMAAADRTGSKMANLGEIRNSLSLKVPDGFVITAAAYDRFLGTGGLRDEINRRLQVVEGDDMEQLHRCSSEIQQLIARTAVPDELAAEIYRCFDQLSARHGGDLRVSMRSSAIAEDSPRISFAGQYRSVLNVGRDFIVGAYKDVVASKYTLQAMSYRLTRGFRDEDIPMCVGCMEMIEPVSGGVMYSRDPGSADGGGVLINAAWGHAKSVVDGTTEADTFFIKRDGRNFSVQKTIRSKERKVVSGQQEGVLTADISPEDRERPALDDEQVLRLAAIAVRLEEHFGFPQDIEWAVEPNGEIVILQSRPLYRSEEPARKQKFDAASAEGLDTVLDSGVTASSGAAYGSAFLVSNTVDVLRFPKQAVLVTRYPFPQWASLIPHAAAVVTEIGGIAGHLATVAREFGVPAIFGAVNATAHIVTGDLITVNADTCRVYRGRVESQLKSADRKRNLMEGSPVYHLLQKILEVIVPLNLTNPDGIEFRPGSCRTVHDITRFCHEMSVREIFHFGQEHSFRKYPVKRLITHVPTQWWVLNLDDGFREQVKGKTVKIGDIVSEPMLAIWEGIRAVQWQGPPPVDTKGFMSILYEATIDTELEPSMKSSYADKNYLIIAKDFCSVSSRFGFHFSTVEAFVSDHAKDNYISFNFKGGAADLERKMRRVEFIAEILRQFGFRVELHGDALLARIEGAGREGTLERLKIMGYLLMHTRQIDMIMNNADTVREYRDNFLRDIRSFVAPSLVENIAELIDK